MAIIINYDLPDNVTVNILPTGETVVNVLPKSPIVVNLCNDNGQSTTDYAALTGKPKINDVELIGNKTLDQLGIEPKRGIDDFYLTGAEKSKLGKLLVDFTVPTDRLSIDFVATDEGILFSDLNIKSLQVRYYLNSVALFSGTMIFRVNGVTTNTYKQNANLTSGVFARFGSESWGFAMFDIINNLLVYETRSANSISRIDDNTSTSETLFVGINRTISSINSIELNGQANMFKAGSTIKIYRND